MEELNKCLDWYSDDVCMIGIWGMGGIGKTTMAQAIYNLLKGKFEGSCFLGKVTERAQQSNGLIDLQEQILSSVGVNSNKRTRHVDEGTTAIIDNIQGKMVLFVFDDVDHLEQLHILAIRPDYFQSGSRFIITTRDRDLLSLGMVDMVYKLPALDYRESIQLFSWHAFGKYPPNENYMDLTLEVVYHARGLPLVVKLLGSCLFGKSASEWKNVLKELNESHHEMFETFMVSFHLLSGKQQKLFSNIALYYVGMEKNYTLGILQDSNLSLESELQILCRRFLVTVDCLNRLTMHDMVRDGS